MEYTFEVYNNRRNNILKYKLKITQSGWNIRHIAINGDCKPNGKKLFYENFDQDFISYPIDFGDYLEWLWNKRINGKITDSETQVKLQELADWVTTCEKSVPKWKGYNI